MEKSSFFRISSLIKKTLAIDYRNICSLGGPNLYHEIAANYSQAKRMYRPCNTVISSIDQNTAIEFQELYFATNIIRTYYSDDITASEVCGALKNVIAFCAGAADGYNSGSGVGLNFKASLITRAAFEIGYFAHALVARVENVYGLAGIGDLIATCSQGRNWKAGQKFISGLTIDQVKEAMFPHEIEGLQTLTVMGEFIKSLRQNNPNVMIELPIVENIYKWVFDGVEFAEAVNRVLNRPLRKEFRTDPYISFEKRS